MKSDSGKRLEREIKQIGIDTAIVLVIVTLIVGFALGAWIAP